MAETPVSINRRGRGIAKLLHFAKNLWTACSEKVHMIYQDLKKKALSGFVSL